MTYLNTRRFKKEGNILYNNINANSLYGVYIDPKNVSSVGNYKKIVAGSFLTSGKRVHGAAKVISPYTAGDTTVVVDNPWSLLPGDVLYQIGDRTNNIAAEKTAYETKSTEFGTVVSIDAGTNKYKATLTPDSIVVGDVYTLQIEDTTVSVTAKTAVVVDLLNLIVKELNLNGRADLGVLDYLEYVVDTDNNTLVITAKETGSIFTINANVVGRGTMALAVSPGIGTLTITPGAQNADLEVGVKLSVTDSVILGVFAHTKYLTDNWQQEMTADIAAYDSANIYLKALPYLDGAIVSQLPTLKFMPSYGN